MENVVREVEFDQNALDDINWWKRKDPAKLRRILRMANECKTRPFTGLGKPEPLKHQLAGCWSRRIDREHRLVYEVSETRVRILACRYHY
ncbi:MAG TPA: Txe/YoeB family addiction module toxin [Candidatus Hydrogenedentes bacterium]|nr:Txe/YoeB family addiction module toxin [Candidatus Hydrogenedentota bacterium]